MNKKFYAEEEIISLIIMHEMNSYIIRNDYLDELYIGKNYILLSKKNWKKVDLFILCNML